MPSATTRIPLLPAYRMIQATNPRRGARARLIVLALSVFLGPLGVLATAQEAAETRDWPQFLGPKRDGTAVVPGLDFASWKTSAPKVAWRAPIGPGYGGAAIAGDDVVILDRTDDKDRLRVLAFADGKERWSVDYDAPGKLRFVGSRTVPLVRGDRIYTGGGFGHVSCFSREDQKLIWQVDLQKDFAGRMPMFGYSSPPVWLDAGAAPLIVAAAYGDEVGLVAFDAATGKPRWKTEPVGYGHSTPAIMELHGRKQIVFASTEKECTGRSKADPMILWGFDAKTGATLWRYDLTGANLPIPAPLAVDERTLFITHGYAGGSLLLRIEQKSGGDARGAKASYSFDEVWRSKRGSQVHQAILVDRHLYLVANENANHTRSRRREGGLTCLSLDGKERWRTGSKPFFGRGALVRINDHLLLQDGFNGVLRAVRIDPERYVEVASFDPFGIKGRRDKQLWAPIAVARGRIVIRGKRDGKDELVCIVL